jgi:hypothetical protein
MYRDEALGILMTIWNRSINEEWPVDRILNALQFQLRLVHIRKHSLPAQFLVDLVECSPKDVLMEGWETPRRLMLDEEYDAHYANDYDPED